MFETWRSSSFGRVVSEPPENASSRLKCTIVSLSINRVLRMIRDKTLPARQACPGAPWVIARADLDAPNVRAAIGRGRGPLTVDPRQQTPNFQ